MKALLVIVTIIGLAAVIGAIAVGTGSFDGLVVEKPYDRGLLWDREHHEKADTGWNVRLTNRNFHEGENRLLVSVTDRQGNALTDRIVVVVVRRPGTSSYDRRYEALSATDGYRATVILPLHGNWDLQIEVSGDSRTVVFRDKIYAEKRNR